MKTYSFLFWGYNVFWIGIAAYVALVYVRLRSLKNRVDRLEKRIGDR